MSEVCTTVTAFRRLHAGRALVLALPGIRRRVQVSKGAGEALARELLERDGEVAADIEDHLVVLRVPAPETANGGGPVSVAEALWGRIP